MPITIKYGNPRSALAGAFAGGLGMRDERQRQRLLEERRYQDQRNLALQDRQLKYGLAYTQLAAQQQARQQELEMSRQRMMQQDAQFQQRMGMQENQFGQQMEQSQQRMEQYERFQQDRLRMDAQGRRDMYEGRVSSALQKGYEYTPQQQSEIEKIDRDISMLEAGKNPMNPAQQNKLNAQQTNEAIRKLQDRRGRIIPTEKPPLPDFQGWQQENIFNDDSGRQWIRSGSGFAPLPMDPAQKFEQTQQANEMKAQQASVAAELKAERSAEASYNKEMRDRARKIYDAYLKSDEYYMYKAGKSKDGTDDGGDAKNNIKPMTFEDAMEQARQEMGPFSFNRINTQPTYVPRALQEQQQGQQDQQEAVTITDPSQIEGLQTGTKIRVKVGNEWRYKQIPDRQQQEPFQGTQPIQAPSPVSDQQGTMPGMSGIEYEAEMISPKQQMLEENRQRYLEEIERRRMSYAGY